jgi:tetratricopeptide (TPR) repeat protein
MKIYLSIILLVISISRLSAQEFILNNEHLVHKINQTLDLIYNFEFEEAYGKIDSMEDNLGRHPVIHFLKSMVLYWRDRPFKIDSEPYLEYQKELETAIELAIPFQDDEKLREEGEFYILAGYGLLTDLYNEVGYRMKAIGSAKKAYNSLKEGFELKEVFPDFYFSSGVYNYYREKYPELRPFYKTFMWVFMSGDMDLGLEQLKIAAEKGVFTQREALIYLFHLYLRYENNPAIALPYTRILIDRFPGNYRFKCLHIEAMVYNRCDSIPHEMIQSLIQHEDVLFQLAGNLFLGLMMEQDNDIKQSQFYLETAQELYETMDREYDHYHSLIYTGMARLALKKNELDDAKKYYKKALKSNPYVPVMEEANRFLKSNGDG